MVGIYKIVNPEGKIYIGCSIDIERRINRDYKILSQLNERFKLHLSLLQYGYDNHIFEILEECDIKELRSKEKYYIKKYNSIEEGLNIREGSGSYKMSQEGKKNISKALKGRKITWDNNKKKISASLKEYYKDEKNREKISKGLKEVWSEDFKKQHSDHLKDIFLKRGNRLSQEKIQKLRKMFNTGKYTKSDLSREFNISWGSVKNIIEKRNAYKD